MSVARLGNPKYDRKPEQPGKTPTVVRPCNGCGGEKFEPPKTPQEMEKLLAEHVQT